MASLPVVDLGVDYTADKGMVIMNVHWTSKKYLKSWPDKIKDFLSKFKGQQEKDLEENFADIDIHDDEGADGDELRSFKYMIQLVRVHLRVQRVLGAHISTAKDRKSGTTNACDRAWGYLLGKYSRFCVLRPWL